MYVNGVLIEDTFAEAFPMRAARIVVTAVTARWAREAAQWREETERIKQRQEE